jgi:GNAT superfamily N-acetyltransferase
MAPQPTSHEGLGTGEYLYRPAEISDAEAIQLVIEKAVAARKGSPTPLHVTDMDAVKRNELQLSKATTWSRLVFEGNRLIGLIIGTPATDLKSGEVIPKREHINLLMIDPGYWGRGIGGNLLDWADGELIARGTESIDLWTGSENSRSHNLYERKGYHATGVERIQPIYGEHQIQYEKNL